MKLSKQQTYLVYVIAGIVALAFLTVQFGFSEILMASFEGEQSEEEIWTNLNVEYRYSMDAPMATVTADFHNNKVFEECYDDIPGEPYCRTYNFTSFDFRLRSIEDTPAYPAGIESYSDNGVELPRGESYNVEFRVRDTLVEGEPIQVELTTRGYEEDGTGKTIEEKLSFTLEPPVYGEPEEETPGFTGIVATFIVLSVSYIISKKK